MYGPTGVGKMQTDTKPFFIVLLFAVIIIIIASALIGNVDLTDSGRSQPRQSQSQSNTPGVNFNVFGGNSSSSSSALSAGGQPVTGKSTSPLNSPCGSSYTVQQGDTLSSIARTCLISVEDLLATNPSITNPNLITVGEKITIFTLPQTALPPDLPITTSVPPALPLVTVTPKAGTSSTPSSVLKPGGMFYVEMKGFPAGAQVQVAIGKVGAKPTNYRQVKADKNGVLKLNVPIPKTAKPDEQWTVTVTAVDNPNMKVTAEPLTIRKE